MGIFWSLIKGLNEVLINSLTCESNEHESVDENLVESLQIDEDEWYNTIHFFLNIYLFHRRYYNAIVYTIYLHLFANFQLSFYLLIHVY